MSLAIQHNLAAMNADRQFGITTKKKDKSTEKLSSGFRINRAADDAAGLAISEKMRRQIRGLDQASRNIQDGISLLQVADGALNEVHDMLHRMTQLSIQAANGTLDQQDRSYLQKEMNALVEEVDRISDTTAFNELLVFQGGERVELNPDGTVATDGSLTIDDFTMADVNVGWNPFSASDNFGRLNLQAVVDNPNLAANGKTYNLIYGSGSTSYPSLVYGEGKEILLYNMQPTSYEHEAGSSVWTRTLHYEDADSKINIDITQSVTVDSANKSYLISGEVKDCGSEYTGAIDLIFHADTAYNNNDRCEGYFVDQERIATTRIYTKDDNVLEMSSANIITGVPSDFSIVDQEHALAFSEKISFAGGSEPDEFSIGYYYENGKWSNLRQPSSIIGKATRNADLGFAALWRGQMDATSSTAGNTLLSYRMSYGITATETDDNLADVTRSNDPVSIHEEKKRLWIQSGVESGSGIWLEIGEMNSGILGIRGIDVSTEASAGIAIGKAKHALEKISDQRSQLGAQQNRLEHSYLIDQNTAENTQAAESVIRDTDMAGEMAEYSKYSILEQAGSSMLAQANQSRQGLLQLLS